MIDRLVQSRLNYWAGLVLDLVASLAMIVTGVLIADRIDHAVAALAAGGFVYSFYEYTLHRWIYHVVPGPVRRIHRVHHRDRSVLIGSPFYFSLGICAITWVVASLLIGRTLGALFAGVILLGYATFSIVHHLSHSERALPGWLDRLRQHHLHHHRHGTANFGILTRFWDRVFGTLATLALCVGCGDDELRPAPDGGECVFNTPADDVTPPPIHTPRWAFRPWISKDISDADDTRAFVDGFASRGIPVGAVVLDSPWETHYNTFVPNPERYPGFDDLVGELHAADIKIVLWVTQMVNTAGFDLEPGGDRYDGASPNYQEGLDCGFYVDDGEPYLWWKGTGSGIDFSDPHARGWWHRQQDPLLDLGIDGWKLDFGEQYMLDPPFDTDDGPQSLQDYSEAYYADFYAYGVARRGDEFVTMVRPYDTSYGFPGRFYARPEHAPVAWVGDNRRDWIGLSDALDHIFRSAAAGYVMVGSDLGGYLDRDDLDLEVTIPFDTDTFSRWTAVSALSPFMELHGRANLAPWTVPENVDETITLYRYWATLHDQLVPFWYSLAEAAYAGGPTIVRPLGDEASWAGDYRWMLGDALLVAPLLDATGVRDVALPAGTWFDWWDPSVTLAGGVTLAGVAQPDRARIPLYVKEGAIIPAEVSTDVTELGTAASAGALTLAIWPAPVETTFTIHHARGVTSDVRASRGAGGITVSLEALPGAVILRVRAEAAPSAVTLDGVALTTWTYDAPTRTLWVPLDDAEGSPTVIQTTP